MKLPLLLLAFALPLAAAAQPNVEGRPFRVPEFDQGFTLALANLNARNIQIPTALVATDKAAGRMVAAALEERYRARELPEAKAAAHEVTLMAYVELSEKRAQRPPAQQRPFTAGSFRPLTDLTALVTAKTNPPTALVKFADGDPLKDRPKQKFLKVGVTHNITAAIPSNADRKQVTPADSTPLTVDFNL